MPDLYEVLTAIMRDHWKRHNNAYPQRIELSASDMQLLLDERVLVNQTMNYSPQPGWQDSFLGVPLQQADVSCVVDVAGERLPIAMPPEPEAPAEPGQA